MSKSNRSHLFDVDRVMAPIVRKEQDAPKERAQAANAEEVLIAQQSEYFKRLRKWIDDERERLLAELSDADPVVIGEMKAFQKFGKKLDADAETARRSLDVRPE